MSSQPKMLLVACSGSKTAQLTREVHRILQDDFGLNHLVELLESMRRADVPKEAGKDHRAPLVSDYFPDVEAQIDSGRNLLKDVYQGKHVVLMEHLLTPDRLVCEGDTQRVSVNDHLMTVRGFLDVIANAKIETLQRTLATPYLSYVRSHSIEKYRERGFHQFDSLRLTLKDFKKDGLDAIVTIDPHSEKAAQISEELQMKFHIINPFQSGRALNPYKLGLAGESGIEVRKKLRPFQNRFAQMKEESGNHLYIVVVDDGTERRCENFLDRAFSEIIDEEELYKLICYFGGDRVSYGDKKSSFKSFSQINEHNIDPQGIYIMLDDMFASGGTSNNIAKKLREWNASRVEVWTSHVVTAPMQYSKANDRSSISKVVCLDTIPQSPILDIEYIPASAYLLAAELYKVHKKLASTR
ncbi:hypothetical protein HZA96_06410 [Candidatus Woesearchaeota archaeon]|nr:hypothetical protein [Candidatus Woesearchaeota archaeon]